MKKIPCDIYSRVCGFYTPVRQWNNGKQEEWKDRVNFKMPPKSIQGVSEQEPTDGG